jgi:disulfide bond formation protein DsbB
MNRYGLYFSWVVACIAVLISLYYSEIRHLEPCHLCWYQRICLFPLAIILGIATYRGFVGIVPFVLPQVVIGFMFALYQVAIQEIPNFNPIDICGAGPSCSEKTFIGLGAITLPMASAMGFLVLFTLLILAWRSHRRKEHYAVNS